MSYSRRELIVSTATGAVIGLAGCSSGGDDGASGESNSSNDGASGGADNEQSTEIVVGAAYQGSSQFEAAQAMQRMVRQESDTVRLSTQETDGSAGNLFQLSQGNIDMGGSSSHTYGLADSGEAMFSDRQPENLPHQGFGWGAVHLYILTPADSDIQSVGDLAGTNFWPQPPGNVTRLAAERILKSAGIWSELNILNIDSGDAAGALEEGRIDAFAGYGVSYNAIPGWATNVDSRIDLRAISLNDSFRTTIDDYPGLVYENINPYGWEQDLGVDQLESWKDSLAWYFHPSVGEDAAYEITKLCHQNSDIIRESASGFPDLNNNVSIMTDAIVEGYPVHPGSAKYFKEIDQWNNSWSEA